MPVICESPAVSGYHTLGLTQNVSQGGLLLEVPEVLVPGTSTGLRLLAGERITRADAMVVWMTQHSPGRMGLQFTGMVGADRLVWEQLMVLQAGSSARTSLRIPINLEVTCMIPPNTRLQGRAENISDGGLLIVFPQTVIPQTHLTVSVPPGLFLPPVETEVVWILAAPKGQGVLHGVRFLAEDKGREQFLLGVLFRRLLD